MLKHFAKILIVFFFLPLVWQICTRYDWARRLENATMDFRYWLRGDINESKVVSQQIPKIIYVNVDNAAINVMGEAPIPLSFYAQAVYALTNLGKSRALISDILFHDRKYSNLVDTERVYNDERMGRQYFENSSNVILGAWYNAFGEVQQPFLQHEIPFPLIYKGFTKFSLVKNPLYPSNKIVGNKIKVGITNGDSIMNGGSTIRWMPLYARTHNQIYYTLGLEVLMHVLKVSHDFVDIYGDDSPNEKYEGNFRIIFLNQDGDVVRKIPLHKRQLMEINWFSSWSTTKDQKVSLIGVLKNYEIIQSPNASKSEKDHALTFFSQFNDAFIFLGNTYQGTDSLIHTPVDAKKVPSITAHANLFKTLYSECYIQHFSWIVELFIVFVLNFFVAIIILYGDFIKRWNRLLMGGIIVYFLLALGSFGIFDVTVHIACPMVAPLGCLFTLSLFGALYQMLVERKQRLRIKSIFGNYLSPEIVSTMIATQNNPQLGGVERDITAFFSDIQNFSTFSELLSPSNLVKLMNEYLTAVTDIINQEGGTLDKYIGDAVVAMFGAPFDLESHALRACAATCRIQEKQGILREKWGREKGINWPQEVLQMRTRIGLNTGFATVGNMGSSTRFNFTMMGDTVNIAARCESGAKMFGVYTLVTEDTYKTVIGESDMLVFRFIDRIIVKGRTHPLSIYEIVGFKKDLQEATSECIDVFEKGIQKYLRQDWIEAIKLFEKSSNLEPLQPNRDVGITINPSLVYKQRCAYMQLHPPEVDWDGVVVMKTK
ncbi:MAG: CHASE2 domain-containing protein [Puniceicoccales bacterium]|jgi:adenylate cyclase|nr:CHASE2 domain-containing protein [Puniceicoccales bacterium]